MNERETKVVEVEGVEVKVVDMEYINCPLCGLQLIKLNTDPLHIHAYWCNNCGIDITIAFDGLPMA